MSDDASSVKQAVQAFERLSQIEVAVLVDLYEQIKNHEGPWSTQRGGEQLPDGSIQMPYFENDPLIYELITFMSEHDLMVVFDWPQWQKGIDLINSEDEAKYDNADLATVLKLLTMITRKERFAEGTLPRLFKTGDMQKLVGRLLKLSNVV